MIILWNYGTKAPNLQSFFQPSTYTWMSGAPAAPTIKNYYTGGISAAKRMMRGMGF